MRFGESLLIHDVRQELENLPVAPEQVGEMPASWLGLPLVVKEVIERHGGRVTLESEVGKGSTFTVWLPIASARA